VTWRAGWRLGWSREAWRLFLADLLLTLPVAVVFIVLFGCAALPVLLSALSNAEPAPGAIIATIGMAFLVIFLAIVVSIVIGLIRELVYRQVVLGGHGPASAIAEAWRLLRRRFKDVGILWLILVGVTFGFGLGSAIVGFLLAIVALLTGGGVGAGLFFLIRAASGEIAAWVTAILSGGLVFMLVLGLPLTFLRGLKLVFDSSTWTLAYRELKVIPEA
jgi:hypothetical protein